MIPEYRELCGGGRLTVITTDRFKTELMTLGVELPHTTDSIIKANLLASVLKRGCTRYPGIAELSRRLDDLYDANIGTMVTSTRGRLSMGFSCECLDKSYIPTHEDLLSGTLDTLSCMATEPLTDGSGTLCADIVESEKKLLCDRIGATENNPRALSYDLCSRELFKGEPAGESLVGRSPDVSAVTPSELTDFFSSYLSSSRPIFVYVGSRSADEVASLITKKLGFFGGTSEIVATENPYIRSESARPISIEREMAVKQGKLTMGFRSGITAKDDDICAAVIMSEIFGGSPASKLFKNVREAKSLCYDCSSFLNIFSGAMFVRSGIRNEDLDTVTEEILAQFDSIVAGKISNTELECAIKANMFAYAQLSDSAYSLESFYRNRSLFGITETPSELAERISRVTKEDVIRVASSFDTRVRAFVRGTLSEAEVDYDDEE